TGRPRWGARGGGEGTRWLGAGGWPTGSGRAVVMTAEPGVIPAPNGAGTGRVLIAAEPDDRWMSLYHYRGQDLPPIARTMLLSAPWQAFGSVREDGQTIAVARVAAPDGGA